jgi:hypothetical protein
LDFRNPDTIFYAANTDLAFGPPSPGYTNWFMVRQTDMQLQERFRHFYGGVRFIMSILLLPHQMADALFMPANTILMVI